MIDRVALLADLQKLLQRLEADLLERSESADVPEIGNTLRAEYDRAKTAERTAQNYEGWRTDAITQAAAAWVLSPVFVRFLEDNRLIDPPKIAGPADRLERARDEHELYFKSHPKETDRDYLLAVFDQLAKLPGTKDVFGEHNPIRELPNWLSGDAAGELLQFFQKIEANTGSLVHDFTDPNWDTRFLGDLYQDLSEAARKKYALLQTPEFVEEFILDRTLNPALDEFGLVTGGQLSALSDQPEGKADSRPLTADSYFKMIDPACGSGHFLLGAFPRILDRWQRKEPGTNVRELVQRTLDSIHGVDVNPYAIAIARFRLLLAAMRACGVTKLADAPGFHLNLVCGDSLLHAPLRMGHQVFDFELESSFVTRHLSVANEKGQMTNDNSDECYHTYQAEDLPSLKKLLRSEQYHAVVANPPYIVPRDAQLNDRYRKRFRSCYRQYSLAVPFLERIFNLAIPGGYTGQITANSFMKREFGKKLIESFLPTVDLTHVIDTSGAYIPGHGTPTVILLGRNRAPVASTLRTVMGIRGEPTTPDDPSEGLVWSAVVEQIDQPGTQSDFVSVADSARELFHKHPWSIGGGGASELKELLDYRKSNCLEDIATEIGFVCITKADELFCQPHDTFRRASLERDHVRHFGIGEDVRDWGFRTDLSVIFPYDTAIATVPIASIPHTARFMWPYRTELGNRIVFGRRTYFEAGKAWHEYGQIPIERAQVPLSIVFGEVATHNHFVLDRGGKVFKQTAPVIKLPPDATEDDHLALLGLLNSSTACFWMKQVCHNKGSTVDQHGARQRTAPFEDFFAFNGTKLQQFPLPDGRPFELARCLDRLAQQLAENSPQAAIERWHARSGHDECLRQCLEDAFNVTTLIQGQMRLLQEELDWECYRLYGLLEEDPTHWGKVAEWQRDKGTKEELASYNLRAFAHLRETVPLQPGQRTFEIVLARKMEAGELQTTWFERHGATPITEIPTDWPPEYQRLVARRIEVIASNPEIALIEQPEYKRRWNWEPWDSQQERALRAWLLDRLEGYFDFDGRMGEGQRGKGTEGQSEEAPLVASTLCHYAIPELTTIARLADVARQDAEFQEVGETYRQDAAFDVQALVADLVVAESVPLLPILRYKPSGLRKRAEWEHTWELQRAEDEWQRENEWQRDKGAKGQSGGGLTDPSAPLPLCPSAPLPLLPSVPPKYSSADFISTGGARYWSLRGKLDVPKERWISFPHCEGPDGTLVICWAGYDHLQQARAISAYYVRVQTEFGGSDDPRLIPLLACLIELLPWLKQWHNDPDPAFDGLAMGDYFEGFVNEEARQLGKTFAEIKAWTPPKKVAKRQSGKGAKGKKKKVAKGQSGKGAKGKKKKVAKGQSGKGTKGKKKKVEQ